MRNKLVREQFNKQAEKFASWAVGKNVEYLQAYCDFCEISGTDNVLDVACGPGDFPIFLSGKAASVTGVDISDAEIDIAVKQAANLGIDNVKFDCSDVEKLPYNNNQFSVVICKSAFHHFTKPEIVFKEMIRTAKQGGKISIQDIIAYDDENINEYFDRFDKLVDVSHNKVLSVNEVKKFYKQNEIDVTREYKLDVDLNVAEYIEHAIQQEDDKKRIDKYLEEGLKRNDLSDYLFTKDGTLYYKRYVYLILGMK